LRHPVSIKSPVAIAAVEFNFRSVFMPNTASASLLTSGSERNRSFFTERFAPSAADHDAVRAAGRDVVEKGFAVLDKALEVRDYVAGNEFSPADAALFYVEFWAAKRLNMKLPPNVAAHFDRMMARPSVQRVMQQEGLN
jgi:glutathione S-transferase